jgi:hypothetical protein
MKALDLGNKNEQGKWIPACITPQFKRQFYQLALLGATEAMIAEFFEVAPSTIQEWKKTDPELAEIARRGRLGADMNVANGWYKKACGYQYEEKTVVRRLNKEGEMITVREEITIKEHAPDAFACMKWLERRHKELWADTQKSEVSIKYKGEMDIKLISEHIRDPKDFSVEELQFALQMGLTQIAKNAQN